jgi:N-acetylglucosaminyl-diphospho-decaprenol L-rhamnosyltransferase
VSTPALSVVIPSRNTRELTLACLASLAAAERERPELAGGGALEVVLVDDAGTDGTAEAVAARHPRARLLRLPSQGGFTVAANRGLAAATGEVLLLLNSDTEVEGAGLPAMLARFAAEPRLGIAGGALRYPDGTPQWSGGAEPGAAWCFALASGLAQAAARLPLYRRLRPASGSPRRQEERQGEPREQREQQLHRRDQGDRAAAGAPPVAWVTGAAMAMRRAVWEEVGPLDERFRLYAQDLDICLRAHDAGWTVAVLPELRVLHHHGATVAAEGATVAQAAGRVGGDGRSGGGGGDRGGAGVGGAGGSVGAAGRGAQQVELLWTDLLRWAAKRGGDRAARRMARALLAGGTLRWLGRCVATPFVPAGARPDFRAGTAAWRGALSAVRAWRTAQGAATDRP